MTKLKTVSMSKRKLIMKRSNLSKVVGATVLAGSLAFLPLTYSASAQDRTNTSADTSARQDVSNTDTRGDRDFDWGWLGLIGLAGLAGLAKKREEPVRYRESNPNEVTSSTYRR
jgi:hypothetical protein